MRNSILLATASVLATAGIATAGETASFMLLPASRAADVSSDGGTVLLYDGNISLWTPISGRSQVGSDFTQAGGLSDDGLAIGGSKMVDGKEHAHRWTVSGGWEDLVGLPGEEGCDANLSSGYDISGDGEIVVGLGWEGCAGRAFTWDEINGMVALPQDGTRSARSNVISSDGRVVGGWEENDQQGFRSAAIWIDGTTEIALMPEAPGEVWALNTDGSIAAGGMNADGFYDAFYWTEADGVVDIGSLTGSNFDDATVYGMTDDGGVMVGSSGNAFFGPPPAAFIWTPEGGMQNLRDLLISLGAEGLDDLALAQATAISKDGRTIVGVAEVGFFQFQGFIATLPGATTCLGDTNGDGVVNFEDILNVLSGWGDCDPE